MVTDTERWINPKILRWARERMNLSPKQVEELTDKLGHKVGTGDLSAWEEGGKEPELYDLEVLAETYACPVGYFMLDEPPHEELPLDFRGLASTKMSSLSYESRLRLREFLTLTDYLIFLVREIGGPSVQIGSATLGDDTAKIAARERERLGLSLESRQQMGSAQIALETCRKNLESLGVFVISLRLNPKEIRGGSRWDPPGPPAILVNEADAEFAAGRLFTLLHEYAHLLVRRAGIICDFRGQEPQMEHFANAFAAEVLVPRAEFKEFLVREGLYKKRDRWGDPLLDRIRSPFLASRDVVAILLEEVGLARRGFYAEKARMWDSRRPFIPRGAPGPRRRMTKFDRKRSQFGLAFTKLIVAGYDRGLVSPLDLAELLDTRMEKAEEFVSWAREG